MFQNCINRLIFNYTRDLSDQMLGRPIVQQEEYVTVRSAKLTGTENYGLVHAIPSDVVVERSICAMIFASDGCYVCPTAAFIRRRSRLEAWAKRNHRKHEVVIAHLFLRVSGPANQHKLRTFR